MTTVHGIELPKASSKNWLRTIDGRIYRSNRATVSRCRTLGYYYEDIDIDDLRAILDAQDYDCAWCFKDIYDRFHMDHIHSLVTGGGHFADNIQFLCPRCNLTKHGYNDTPRVKRLTYPDWDDWIRVTYPTKWDL